MLHADVSTDRVRDFVQDREVLAMVRRASAVRNGPQIAAIGSDWAIIVAAIVASEAIGGLAAYSAAVIVIATRQHALLTLAHEAVHKRLLSNPRWNDAIGDWLCGYPSGLALSWYRANHLAHHRHLNTKDDPDWARKVGQTEWTFPASGRVIASSAAKVLAIGGLSWVALMAILAGFWPLRNFTRARAQTLASRVGYWAVIAGALAASGGLIHFAKYWIAPLVLVFPLIFRVRSWAEHFGLRGDHELNASRNVLAGRIECFLFSPHSVNYHLLHHLFPSVPQHALAGLHRELGRFATYRSLAANNGSYFLPYGGSVLEDLRTVGPQQNLLRTP